MPSGGVTEQAGPQSRPTVTTAPWHSLNHP